MLGRAARGALFPDLRPACVGRQPAVSKVAAIGFKGEKDTRTSVSVYCRVNDPTSDLRPGTTGYARIYTGPRPVGAIIFYRMLRFVRTEFWSLW